jgi:translation initiation factor 2 alpha subunit (eIF-2alpha)
MEEGDIVLCTVVKIERTTVFVKIEDTDKEGTIITSEIAPGRIRNLRDYVVPGKKIVCKVLNIDRKGNIHLSLRRVTEKERREVIEKYEKEKSSLSVLKSITKEKFESIAGRIKEKEGNLYDFFLTCKENPKLLEKYLTKQEAEKICKILKEKKEKQKEVKKKFELTSDKPDGLTIIKTILLPYKDSVNYVAAGRFVLEIKGENYKLANSKAQEILQDIENRAKNKAEFKVKEK